MSSPDGLRVLAERLAREAADLIRTGTGGDRSVQATKSSPTDVVTAMDRAVEELLRSRIRQERPQDAVLGEEGGLAGPSGGSPGGLTWVLDPIDGTVNYTYGLPAFAVSVAVVSGDPRVPGAWTPQAGCVLQPGSRPAGDQVWTAARGAGASANGTAIRMPAPPPLGRALVATGFGYRAERRAGQARVVAALLPRIRDIRRIGSAALDLCWLAEGRLDAYYERGVNVWDIAAAALVVREAGGEVTGLRGAPASPETTVAAGRPLLGELSDLLADLAADTDQHIGQDIDQPTDRG